MPDKSKQFYGRRRNRRRDIRKPFPQAAKVTPVAAPGTQAQGTASQVKPVTQVPPAAKAPVKAPPQPVLKVTPVKELKRIGIIAGSMFVILIILALVLK